MRSLFFAAAFFVNRDADLPEICDLLSDLNLIFATYLNYPR